MGMTFAAWTYNGRMPGPTIEACDITARPGRYFVNVGPGASAAHVIGTVFDGVYAGAPWVEGVQTFPVPAGAGAMLEFYIPEAGVFPFVDHDKLAFLPFGLALTFSTADVSAQ